VKCLDCPRPPEKGKARCRPCIDRNAVYSKRCRQDRLAAGLCVQCKEPREQQGRTKCDRCLRADAGRSSEAAQKVRTQVIEHYGGKCSCPGCSETNPGFLTIDHPEDDGADHRREIAGDRDRQWGGTPFYRWIIRNGFPTSLRLMCFNCNCGRQRNGGVCPHLAPLGKWDAEPQAAPENP